MPRMHFVKDYKQILPAVARKKKFSYQFVTVSSPQKKTSVLPEEKLSKRSEKKRRGKRRIRISSSHCAVRSNGDQKDGHRTGSCRGNVIFYGCAFSNMARRSTSSFAKLKTYTGIVSCLPFAHRILLCPCIVSFRSAAAQSVRRTR